MLEDLLKEARGWLADCGDRVPEADIALVLKINRNYEGGWPEFVRADPDAIPAAVLDEVERRYPVGVTMTLYPQTADPTPSGDPALILG